MILIRIAEKLLILYFGLYLLMDILLYLGSFVIFLRRKKPKPKAETDPVAAPFVSVIVPAYNEEVSIVPCIRMLLDLDYPAYEVIVVNDGSKDATRNKMLAAFAWGSDTKLPAPDASIHTSTIESVYASVDKKLIFIDKQNGGKADAINAAILVAKGKYICTIDADSILDREALTRVIEPLERDPAVFVSGGQLALSNNLVIKGNRVVSARMPRNIWVHWQILEYISTFMVARISLSRINALLIMSGAFSVFRKEDLLATGGFLTKTNHHPYILQTLGKGKHTITEDMEVVLRLWKYHRDGHRPARAVFLPGPVCWTEAPEKPSQLYKQRMRWHQGLAETLSLYRKMMFEPKYRMTGMIALPYYFFMELMAPVVKLFSVGFVIYMVAGGYLNRDWVLLMLVGTILITTIVMSTITVLIENWSSHQSATNRDALRYKNLGEWTVLLLSGILANFSYSFYRMFAQLHGLVNFFRKKQEWNKFERKGVVYEDQLP